MFVSNKCNQYLNLMTGSRYRDLYTEIVDNLYKPDGFIQKILSKYFFLPKGDNLHFFFIPILL